MADKPNAMGGLTRVAVVAFVIVTAVMLLPGYIERWSAEPPEDAEYYVRGAVDRKARVFHDDGSFGRMPSDVTFGRVTSFSCEGSAAATREYGWRGAREVLFDCPATFEDGEGNGYAWVFRLIPEDDPIREPSPEGYRTMHIPAADARVLLVERGLFP
ncbi:MAG: hypothetical protein ACU0D2_06795 [Roseovarius indicus]